MNNPIARDDRMASIWRFLLAVVVIFAVLTLAGASVGTIFMMAGLQPRLEITVFWEAIIFVGVILATFKLILAALDRRRLGSMGLAFHPRCWLELTQGLTLGALMILLVAVAEWRCGYASFGFSHRATLPGTLFGLCLFAAAAIKEEVIFRGYALQRLTEAITPVGAILVTSALFGLVHMANPHHTWISTANTALVGVTFSVAYLRTQALWLPIGLHFIWNFILGTILGLPVSGLIMTPSLLAAHISGSERITGGAYGPEGGLVATVVIVIATAYLALSKSIFAAEEMKALVATPLPSGASNEAISILPAPPQE